MNELWVARDSVGGQRAYIYHERPTLQGGWYHSSGNTMFDVEDGAFDNLKPGECRRLVMESEVSDGG